MHRRIEDYLLIGDLYTAALVGKDGSLDRLCLPSFASPPVFGAGVDGAEGNGRWCIAPTHSAATVPPIASQRRYRGDSLILDTHWEIPAGTVRVTDFMPPRDGAAPQVIRIVEGTRGRVRMHSSVQIAASWGGETTSWSSVQGRGMVASGRAGAIWLDADAPVRAQGLTADSEFTIADGERVTFTLSWQAVHTGPPCVTDSQASLARTETSWSDWAEHDAYDGPYRDVVIRTLITLRALFDGPLGGAVAAPSGLLPEGSGAEAGREATPSSDAVRPQPGRLGRLLRLFLRRG